MGLYSTIINSCELLGEELAGGLQTKDLEDCFNIYWIDPAGRLFLIDYSKCSEFVPKDSDDDPLSFFPMKLQSTGTNGRVYPVMLKRWIKVYNSMYDAGIYFDHGRVAGITQPTDRLARLTGLTSSLAGASLGE